MKICYVGSAKSIHMQRWAKWFADRGHEVHLISSNYEDIEGVKIHLIGKKEGSVTNFIRKMLQTRKLVWKIKPDILHAHYAFGYGTFAAFSGYHPLIISIWGSDLSRDMYLSEINKRLILYAFKKADLIHVWDTPTRDKLLSLGICRDKILVQPWGVDTEKFSPCRFSKKLREKFGGDFLVICAREWKKHYRVDVVIKSLQYISDKLKKELKVILLGGGPLESQLKSLAKQLGVEDMIFFVGRIPHNDMPKYLATADMLVDTYIAEREGGGIGIAVLEAMACGTPVLMAERKYMMEKNRSLKDEKWFIGDVYRPGDPVDLAKKIEMFLLNRKLIEEKKKMCREIVNKNFDWNVFMNKIQDSYEQLIGK